MNLNLIKTWCSYTEKGLNFILVDYLMTKGYSTIDYCDDYIVAEGSLPVCLIGHMDTVFSSPPKYDDFLYDPDKKILWSPAGSGFDDRAAIYAIVSLIEDGYRPSIVFTSGEEQGCTGAKKLVKDYPNHFFENCKFLIELDRANKNDMVFYQCGNQEFEKFIGSFGFEKSLGTFSDISIIAPAWGLAAVNLSIGYVDEHTTSERLYCDWCDLTIEKVKDILDKSIEVDKFEYRSVLRCLICNCDFNNKTPYYVKNENFPIPALVCKDCYKEFF